MTRDSTLQPILILSLALTVAASALTYRRNRATTGPLLLTIAASVWIYAFIFLVDSGHGGGHGTMGDHMTDHHVTTSTAAHHGLSTTSQSLVWVGFAILIGAQLWDPLRLRSRRRTAKLPGATT